MKGKILYNLINLKEGECLKVYSSDTDIFDNEMINVYIIDKKSNQLYVRYKKKVNEEQEYKFEEKIDTIGALNYKVTQLKQMKLAESERKHIKSASIENNLIRKGYPLSGKLENGLSFEYPNIIAIEKGE